MAVTASESFAQLLEESDIVAPEDLPQVKATIESSQGDALRAARSLIRQGTLTRWQAQQLLAGRHRLTLGKYKLLERLGRGGMGDVYLAEHRQMKRRVALKTLNRELSKEPGALKRLVAEARAIASLDHPNIIRAYDLETEGNLYYIVMEYVDGDDLEKWVREQGKMPIRAAADHICQAAAGLAHAHERGMIHRDIKPANLLVDKLGVVKILDLGLAQLGDHQASAHTPVEGTVDFISPEQATGDKNIDARADIYSLGCTFYFLLTGQPPFGEGSLAQRLARHQMDEPQPIDQVRGETPGMLVDICRRMMAKKPADRFQTAEEVHAALAKWLAQTPIAALGTSGGMAAVKDSKALPRRSGKPGGTGKSPSDTLAGSNSDTQIGDLGFINDDPPATVRRRSDSSSNNLKLGGKSGIKRADKARPTAEKPVIVERRAPPPKNRMPLYIGLGLGGVALLVVSVLAAMVLLKPKAQQADVPKPAELAKAPEKFVEEFPADPVEDKKPEAQADASHPTVAPKPGDKPDKKDTPPVQVATSDPKKPDLTTLIPEKPPEAKPPETKAVTPPPAPPVKPPSPPAKLLTQLLASVELPVLAKSGDAPSDVAAVSLGRLHPAKMSEVELKLLPPGGAKGKPLPLKLVKQDKGAGVHEWQVATEAAEAAEGSEAAAAGAIATIACAKDGNVTIQWAADAAKSPLADQLRNAVLVFSAPAGETRPVFLRVPKPVDPITLDFESGKISHTVEIASMPHSDTVMLEVYVPNIQNFQIMASDKSPLPTPAKEPLTIKTGEQARNISINLQFKKGKSPLIDLTATYMLGEQTFPLTAKEMAGQPQRLDAQINQIDARLKEIGQPPRGKLSPTEKAQHDAQVKQMRDEGAALKQKVQQAISNFKGIQKAFTMLKTSKLDYRVYSKVDDFEVNLLISNPKYVKK